MSNRWIIAFALLLTLIFIPILANAGANEGFAAAEEGDFATALEEWIPIAERGDATTQYNVGQLYAKGGGGVEKNMDEAIRWYKMAADQDEGDAQFHLGLLYLRGNGVEKDESVGLLWISAAADNDIDMAQFYLGRLLLTGTPGIEQNVDKGIAFLQKAADSGLAEAELTLGLLHLNSSDKSEHQTGFTMIKLSADRGLAEAQTAMGDLYAQGQGVEIDPDKAADWYGKAADQGQVMAQYNLGIAALEIEDGTNAEQWLLKAAEQGMAEAEFNLGFLYENGLLGEPDIPLAAEWYQKAADKGLANAQHNLATLYYNGTGIDRDLARAAELYEQAAAQGFAESEKNLVAMEERGETHGGEGSASAELARTLSQYVDKDEAQKVIVWVKSHPVAAGLYALLLVMTPFILFRKTS